MLAALTRALSESDEWFVISLSFEGMGSKVFTEEALFVRSFLRLVNDQMRDWGHLKMVELIEKEVEKINTIVELSSFISTMINHAPRKWVLLIDEVDKSSNNQLFLDFLGMLRNKFLRRDFSSDATFHCVVLAGLHDVKSLKSRIRNDSDSKYNSPWNIAADFDVVMELQVSEILPMLEDYSRERGISMDFQSVAEMLYFYTSGYPFLVSALCKIVDEKVLPLKSTQEWTVSDVERAADIMIRSERSNTNFDSLIKNLENDPALYDVVYRMVIENDFFNYNVHDPIISYGIQHGIFKNGNGLSIQNRIYREIIANYMTSKTVTSGKSLYIGTADPYLLANNGLDMRKVLLKFQELMQMEYSKRDTEFVERNGRLLFLAFIKPIINGKGYTFKEPEISEERRMDIAVNFFQHKYIVELKMWRGEVAHKRGLAQLNDYLERQLQQQGFLVIFEQKTQKTWKSGWIRMRGKRIFVVYV
jgi:hypothetical protein